MSGAWFCLMPKVQNNWDLTGIERNFCSKDREDMVKFQAVKTIALESVDFFPKEMELLGKT